MFLAWSGTNQSVGSCGSGGGGGGPSVLSSPGSLFHSGDSLTGSLERRLYIGVAGVVCVGSSEEAKWVVKVAWQGKWSPLRISLAEVST